MSSSDAQESFKIGAHVEATDGRCGNLARLIFNPITDLLTHLIVEPGHHDEQARLVPVDLVVSAGDDVIKLSCTKERYDQLDSAEDVQFLPGETTGQGYGANSAALPYFGIGLPLGHHGQPMYSDRVPVGEVEIRRGDPVHAKDGEIGAVEGLVIDPADHHVTHVLLQEGHLWGHKQVAIPIGVSNRVDYEVRVDLTKDEIEALPPVSLKAH
ncbi:MAG TPA: PRC-barrel domain-containing protein [Solirubrobacteraceae bacterium]|nr:PRC-barrel domain-containing protein [Solirubrobacteraceae bacterium]